MGLEWNEKLSDHAQHEAGHQIDNMEALLEKCTTAPVPGSECEAKLQKGSEDAEQRRREQREQWEQIAIPGQVEEEGVASDRVVSTPVPGTIKQGGEQAQIEQIRKQAK